MQLIDAYKSGFVGKMYPDRLLKILRGEHPTVYVKNIVNGVMIFSDDAVLKCVGDYYERPSKNSGKNKSQKNLYLRCRQIRKEYELNDVSDVDCRACHVSCILKEKSRELKRRKFKKR